MNNVMRNVILCIMFSDKPATWLYFCTRLQTLVCQEILLMRVTTCHKVVRFPSNGQPLRLYTIISTPLPVTFGAMGVCFTRYGVLDRPRLAITPTQRLDIHHVTCPNEHMQSYIATTTLYRHQYAFLSRGISFKEENQLGKLNYRVWLFYIIGRRQYEKLTITKTFSSSVSSWEFGSLTKTLYDVQVFVINA